MAGHRARRPRCEADSWQAAADFIPEAANIVTRDSNIEPADVAQEALKNLSRTVASGQPLPMEDRGYLFRVTRNAFRDLRRKEARQPSTSLNERIGGEAEQTTSRLDAIADRVDQMEQLEHRRVIEQIIAEARSERDPARRRVQLELLHAAFAGETLRAAALAAELGLTRAHVSQIATRARAAWRESLEVLR